MPEMTSDLRLMTCDCFAHCGHNVSQVDHHLQGKSSAHCRARHGMAYRPSKSAHLRHDCDNIREKKWA